MTDARPSNVLFVVLDSCRLDAATSDAPTLRQLARDNVWFENAIAPATWSLPSHASLLTGQYPHEHGTYRLHETMTSPPLVDALAATGYWTYGVSSNGFAGPRMRLDEVFDDFTFTGGDEPFPDGVDIYPQVYRTLDDDTATNTSTARKLVQSTLTHDEKAKSIVNLAAVLAGRAATRFEPLQRMPHPIFSPQQGYSYDATKNVRAIQRILRSASDRSSSFFLFTNFIDPHRPYTPLHRISGHSSGRNSLGGNSIG